MAQQIKKKFIGQDQIDGSKIKLLEGQSIRGTNSLGQEVDLVKISSQDKVEVLGQEVALKSALEQEASDRQSGDASTLASAQSYADQKIADLVNSAPEVLDTLKELSDALGGDANFATTIAGQIGAVDDRVDQEILDRQAAVLAEESARIAADSALQSTMESNYTGLDNYISSVEDLLLEETEDRQAADQMLQQSIQAEQSRASQAEQELDSRLDILEPKVSTLESEMDLVEQSVQAEQSRASQAEQELDSRLDILEPKVSTLESEMNMVEQSVQAEQSARIAADAALQSQIDSLNGNFATDAELASAVSSLESQIDDVDGYAQDIRSDLDNLDGYAQDIRSDLDQEILDRQSADSVEQAARIAGDSSLQSQIDAEESRAMGIEAGLQSEINALEGVVQGNFDLQQSDIDGLRSDVDAMSTSLSNETAARIAGDQSTLDASKAYTDAQVSAASDSATNYTDTQIGQLAEQVNENFDNTLLIDGTRGMNGNLIMGDVSGTMYKVVALANGVDAHDATNKGQLDSAKSELQSNIDIEKARIDSLEAKGFSRGVVIVGAELAFVDLDRQYSILLSVSVGRLMVHEGEDFTVSVVDGKTRLTWIGSLLSPSGEEAIEAGDKVFFSGAF